MSDQAMAKRTPESLAQTYDTDKFHYLAPKTLMAEVPRGMRLIATRVDVNPDSDDVYPIPGPGGKHGITKPLLNQCAAAAGISWLYSRRIDDKKHPHYVEWEVRGRMMTTDGSVREETSNKTIDFRNDIGDGSKGADRQAMSTERQLTQALPNINSLAETKAKNRCIRSLTGMKTAYTKQELGKAFIFVKLTVDPNSELGGKAAMAAMYGATDALFGPAPAPEVRVVDAVMDDTQESVEAVPPAASADSDLGTDTGPDVNQTTGEVQVGTPEIIEQVKRLWLYAKAKGMAPAKFKEICKASTGKERKEEFTLADVGEVVKRIEAFLANSGDDEMPV